MQKEGRSETPIHVEVCTENTTRVVLLEQRGFIRGEQLDDVIGMRSLTEPIPAVTLPEGFSIRPIEGLREAEKIVATQNASFGWSWTPEDYRRVMQSPGYQAENQLVVVAPEGHFVSFCYLMFDEWNKIGMIEDVGTHPDFQRKGLARALLYDGMKRMQAKGMVSVFIPYFAADAGASGLYTSVGFRVQYRNYIYTKDPIRT
jgi:ribosomal protein S18 acetylase RimI-like enzyme